MLIQLNEFEFDPLCAVAWSHLDSVPQVKFVVLGAAENRQQEVGLPEYLRLPALHKVLHYEDGYDVESNYDGTPEPAGGEEPYHDRNE